MIYNGEFVSDKETSEVREDSNLEYTFGTITGVDIEGHLVKIAIEGKEGEERVVMPRGIQVWEKQKKTYTNITLSEIVVGDKVLSTGSGVRHCSLNVFR
ncbi:MAG: hypothetical protein IKA17_02885 [Clostridia bacterium]|nr:hypothetical protein [Clostridia bacterium]